MTTPPAEDPPPIPDGYVSVLGMLVPLPLAARILAAFRGTYPELTKDAATDDEAVQAVVKHWTGSTLTSWEARLATAPAEQAVQEAQAERDARRAEAAERAARDLAEIKTATRELIEGQISAALPTWMGGTGSTP